MILEITFHRRLIWIWFQRLGDFEAKGFGTKSLIGLTPINPDGIMILVWTEYGKHKKHRTEEEIKMDHERRAKSIYASPGKYFLYIPCICCSPRRYNSCWGILLW